MFRFGERGSLSAAMREAGFSEVEEEPRTLPWNWPGSAEEVWEYAQAVSTPFRPLLERVPAGKREEIDREVVAEIRTRMEGEVVKFGAVVVLASGRP